ncbi:glycosyltransferase family 2 protein [Polynucleobacter yangtzensis]|uniref:glycosyltransferase family 2 protein n=1 Tax=Polynucleobacter yangtzensis TaxID=1743159 RepID=UPI0008373AA6|nr:glycosyltransferase family 2 protein [Polynucleobacter yangtzensis]
MKAPKISIITVSFNSAETIANTLRSVKSQKYCNYEHIVIDGGSKDETLAIIQLNGQHLARVVSEPDKGIYDAMNKGLAIATGELVGFLNSDDVYADENVLSEVACNFAEGAVDYVYGDILMLNNSGKVVRHWRTGIIPAGGFCDTQIPHPAFWVRRHLLDSLIPAFDPSYRISADLKQQLILINKLGARGRYIKRPLTLMSLGGASTKSLRSYVKGWRESSRAYNDVFGSGGWIFTFKKVFSKVKGIRKIY